VQDEISRAIAGELRLELGAGERLARQETADPEAHTLLLRGLAAMREGTAASMAEADRLLRQATERDPRYARAHALRADLLTMRANYRLIPPEPAFAEARAAANRAIALDPNTSEAHRALGRIADIHDWKFAEAEQYYRHASTLNPADARVHLVRGALLTRLGRSEEAIQAARRSVELDPLSASSHNALGVIYAYSGRPREAIEPMTAALALSPSALAVTSNLAYVYSIAGRHADAIRNAERVRALQRDDQLTLATLGYVYGRAGRRAEAEKALAALRAKPDAAPYLIAGVYAGLGDRERAFQMLDRAVDQRDDLAPDLVVDPVFADLRGDPRFPELLRRIGLR